MTQFDTQEHNNSLFLYLVCMQVISNAKYKSVEHRALANAVERFSIAFFFNPNGRVPIGPAQELITLQSPPLYHPVTYNEYRLYVRKRGPHGKSQIDSLTASQNWHRDLIILGQSHSQGGDVQTLPELQHILKRVSERQKIWLLLPNFKSIHHALFQTQIEFYGFYQKI